MISKNIIVKIQTKPDLRLLQILTRAYMDEYMKHPESARLVSNTELTEGRLLEYFHDLIIIRTLQVENANGVTIDRSLIGFRQNLYVPDGFGPFILNRIGNSSMKLSHEYTLQPVLGKDYKAEVEELHNLGYTDNELFVGETKAPELFMSQGQMARLSNSILRLCRVVSCNPSQFNNSVETSLEAIFAYKEQITGSSVEVESFAGHEMDENNMKVAAILGFCPLETGSKVLYPNMTLVNLNSFYDLYKISIDADLAGEKVRRSKRGNEK